MIEEKTDIRTLRTRKAIVDTFVDLLEIQDFTSITISQIAEEAMINRATFYRHFLDKYDLLEKTIQEILMKKLIVQLNETTEFNQDMLKDVFLSITEFYKSLSNRCQSSYGDMTMNIEVILKKELQKVLYNALSLKYPEQSPNHLTSIATMLSWMLYGASIDWEQNSSLSPDAYFGETSAVMNQIYLQDLA